MTGSFLPYTGDVGNHLFSDIVADQPLEPVHPIFGRIPRPTRRSVLDLSPYEYPEGVSLVRAYLASGMIRGIGPVYAKKLVSGFGEAVFDS